MYLTMHVDRDFGWCFRNDDGGMHSGQIDMHGTKYAEGCSSAVETWLNDWDGSQLEAVFIQWRRPMVFYQAMRVQVNEFCLRWELPLNAVRLRDVKRVVADGFASKRDVVQGAREMFPREKINTYGHAVAVILGEIACRVPGGVAEAPEVLHG